MRRGRTARGFTLIELAVVIAIVGLLLGAVLSPLATQLSVRKNRDAERVLRDAREALMGYAVSQGRLPCPDTDRDGLEDAPCNDDAGDNYVVGFVPWQTLDVNPIDPWGRILGYGVSDEFTYFVRTGQPAAANQLDILDTGNANVVSPDLQTKVPTNLTFSAPVVLLSAGANGYGGTYLDGAAIPQPGGIGADEAENLNGDPTFVQRIRTDPAGACDDTVAGSAPCEFDDVVTWISGAQLMGLMVQAGQLP
jgi:prepilin-type N-terminal cleavage/methylation domain-containing protein